MAPRSAVVSNAAKHFVGATLPQLLLGRKLAAFFSSLPTEGQRKVDIRAIYHVYTWLALQKGLCLCPVKVVATGHRFSINDHEVTAEHQ